VVQQVLAVLGDATPGQVPMQLDGDAPGAHDADHGLHGRIRQGQVAVGLVRDDDPQPGVGLTEDRGERDRQRARSAVGGDQDVDGRQLAAGWCLHIPHMPARLPSHSPEAG
jgi:hypothetical protein